MGRRISFCVAVEDGARIYGRKLLVGNFQLGKRKAFLIIETIPQV